MLNFQNNNKSTFRIHMQFTHVSPFFLLITYHVFIIKKVTSISMYCFLYIYIIYICFSFFGNIFYTWKKIVVKNKIKWNENWKIKGKLKGGVVPAVPSYCPVLVIAVQELSFLLPNSSPLFLETMSYLNNNSS